MDNGAIHLTKVIHIPGGEARSFHIKTGELLKVTDVAGQQVADFIAISLHQKDEYLSTAHTRTMNGRLTVMKGDLLYSNYRQPLLEMVEDTVGVHDTLYPCCDPMRYQLDFGVENHRNCRDNFALALKDITWTTASFQTHLIYFKILLYMQTEHLPIHPSLNQTQEIM